jgi:hypothetical protein
MSCSTRMMVISRGSRRRRSERSVRSPRDSPTAGLVEHEQARLGGQRHPQLELSLLAVREGGDWRVEDVGQVDEAGHLGRPCP